MRSALFWVIMQGTVVILYQSFGTAHWSHLQGLEIRYPIKTQISSVVLVLSAL